MSIAIWYLGIIVNGSLLIIVILLAGLLIHRTPDTLDQLGKARHLTILSGLMGTALMNSGLLLLYFQAGQIQQTMTIDHTHLPVVIIAGYHIVLLSMSLLLWIEYTPLKRPAILVIAQAILSVICVVTNTDFFVIWDNGSVILIIDPLVDAITLYMGLIVAGITFYMTYVRRVHVLGSIDTERTHSIEMASARYLQLGLAFFLQFLIPRAVADSPLDSFSVKIIGFIVTLVFVYSLYQFAKAELTTVHRVLDEDFNEEIAKGPTTLQLIVSVILVLLVGIASRLQPVLTEESKPFLFSQSLYIGAWSETAYYLNYYAVLIPALIWTLLIITNEFYLKKRKTAFQRPNATWLILSALIGFGLLVTINISSFSLEMTYYSTAFKIIWPFSISSILSAVITDRFKLTSFFSTDGSGDKSRMWGRIIYLYGVTLFFALIADVVITSPPFSPQVNYVFLGAVGVLDGLFWAPLLAVIIFELAIAFAELLYIEHDIGTQ